MDQIKMGRFIALLRKKQKMTQLRLAEKLGVSDKSVSKWEKGRTSPDISILNQLSSILNITTTELLNGEYSNLCYHPVNKDIDYYQTLNKQLLLFLNNIYEECSVFLVESDDTDYKVNGLIVMYKNQSFININLIENNNHTNTDLIYVYDYSFCIKKDEIYRSGNILLYDYTNQEKILPIDTILHEIKIYIVHYSQKNNLMGTKLKIKIQYINQCLERKVLIINLKLHPVFFENKVV